MSHRLSDAIVKSLPVPADGNRIAYNSEVKGFGCRVTAAGSRAFILNYRTRAGRERRYTIGSFSEWKTAAARVEAAELKRRIDAGDDPLGAIEDERAARPWGSFANGTKKNTFQRSGHLRERRT